MRSDTQTITIEATPKDVVAFLGEGDNLPRWAIGFAKEVQRDGDKWLVRTGQGEVPTQIHTDAITGTVDYCMEPAPGAEAVAHVRVLPNGHHSEVVFTQFQQQGVSDEVFEQLVTAVRHELVTLK